MTKENLIIQFPVFVHPHNQQCLMLYQLEPVPVPIVDENENAQPNTYIIAMGLDLISI